MPPHHCISRTLELEPDACWPGLPGDSLDQVDLVSSQEADQPVFTISMSLLVFAPVYKSGLEYRLKGQGPLPSLAFGEVQERLLSYKHHQHNYSQNYPFLRNCKNNVFVAKMCKYALSEGSEGFCCSVRKPAWYKWISSRCTFSLSHFYAVDFLKTGFKCWERGLACACPD